MALVVPVVNMLFNIGKIVVSVERLWQLRAHRTHNALVNIFNCLNGSGFDKIVWC